MCVLLFIYYCTFCKYSSQDNYHKNQGVKPKKPRKKTKPSALTRPPKKGKKKKNQKRRSHPQKPSPVSEPTVCEESRMFWSFLSQDASSMSLVAGRTSRGNVLGPCCHVSMTSVGLVDIE